MPVPAFPPTDEQQHAIDLFQKGDNVVINALAGTGKTSTLQHIAAQAPARRGLYAAFGKAIQLEAERKFQGLNAQAVTMHALAYRTLGIRGTGFQQRLDRRGPINWSVKTGAFGIKESFHFPSGSGSRTPIVHKQSLVGHAQRALDAFLKSPDADFTPEMVTLDPKWGQLSKKGRESITEAILDYARKGWKDINNPDGILRFTPDCYLKMFLLSDPKLEFDYIMLDEAQDADPIITAILQHQTDAQIVTVGDANQAIYEWRGAQNAMDAFQGSHASLTQSFRFGDQIASYANEWLDMLGSPLQLRGAPDRPSSVHPSLRQPEAVLTRTNAQAIAEIVRAQEDGHPTGIAGEKKAKEIRELAQAALDLLDKGYTRHPELEMFNTWHDVVQHAESEDGEDMRPLVNVIERVGAPTVIRAIDRCVPTQQARTVVSTAHVSKGLEWKHVRISDDFREPPMKKGAIQPIPAEEARLAYVAATRAMRHLDPSGLDWVPGYIARGGWVEGQVPVRPAEDMTEAPRQLFAPHVLDTRLSATEEVPA